MSHTFCSGAGCSHNYSQDLWHFDASIVSNSTSACHTTKLLSSFDNPTMCKRQSHSLKDLGTKKVVQFPSAFEVALVSAKWFKVLQMKARESGSKPTFTGNDPCVNTFGPGGHPLILLLIFACLLSDRVLFGPGSRIVLIKFCDTLTWRAPLLVKMIRECDFGIFRYCMRTLPRAGLY